MNRIESYEATRSVVSCDLCDALLKIDGVDTGEGRRMAFMPVRGHTATYVRLVQCDVDGDPIVDYDRYTEPTDLCGECIGDLAAWLQHRADSNRGSAEA